MRATSRYLALQGAQPRQHALAITRAPSAEAIAVEHHADATQGIDVPMVELGGHPVAQAERRVELAHDGQLASARHGHELGAERDRIVPCGRDSDVLVVCRVVFDPVLVVRNDAAREVHLRRTGIEVEQGSGAGADRANERWQRAHCEVRQARCVARFLEPLRNPPRAHVLSLLRGFLSNSDDEFRERPDEHAR